MKLFKILLTVSFFSSLVSANITTDQEYLINHADYAHMRAKAGTLLNQTKGMLVARYNYATHGGGSTTEITLTSVFGDKKADAKFPARAIVTNAWIQNLTSPVATNGAAATIALRVNAAADIFSATTVAAWPGTYAQAIPTGATTTYVRLNFANESVVKMKIATESLTAGKFNVFLEYVIGD